MQQAPYVTSPIITVKASVNLELGRELPLRQYHNRTSPLHNVRNGTRKHQKALRHLKCDQFSSEFPNLMDSLVDFEGIIGGKLSNSFIQQRILQDLGRYLMGHHSAGFPGGRLGRFADKAFARLRGIFCLGSAGLGHGWKSESKQPLLTNPPFTLPPARVNRAVLSRCKRHDVCS